MIFFQKIALPLAWIYGSIVWCRRCLYEKGIFKTHTFKTPVIGVGNLSVGGSGKTPHVEFLVSEFSKNRKIAVLSRGYGRRTRGFIKVEPFHTAEQVGDEPLQYVRKFNSECVGVFVCENRAEGIRNIEAHYHADCIILDDAYQHLRVHIDFNILLTDYARLFTQDFPLPAGRLREFRTAAKHTDFIVVTKCPELTVNDKNRIIESIRKYSLAPVDFSRVKYGNLKPFNFAAKAINFDPEKAEVLLLSGIANPQIFISYMESQFNVFKILSFSDHHQFTKTDLLNIKNCFQGHSKAILVTTEKDAMRLTHNIISEIPCFYLPMEVEIEIPINTSSNSCFLNFVLNVESLFP